jgi:hypothetical protein
MATKTATPKPFEDEQSYSVKFKEPVFYGRAKFLPLPVHEMTGAVLNAIVAEHGADVVDFAEAKEV